MVFIKKIKKGKAIYLAEVKSVRVGEKVRHEFIRYVGKELDGKTVLSGSLERAVVDRVVVYGPLLVLHDIAKQLGLHEHLGPFANEILALVYGHCVQPRSIRKIAKWFSNTELNRLLELDDVTELSLYEALDSIEELDVDNIQGELFERARRLVPKAVQSVVYDVTNTYLYGIKCPLAKQGYSKDKKGEAQIQIALSVTYPGGLPVSCKTFSGEVHDSRTLPILFEHVTSKGLPNPSIVFDRGCVSTKALIEAQNAGFEVVCGVPMQKRVKEKTRKFLKKLLDASAIKATQVGRKTLFYVECEKTTWNERRGFFYICLNQKNRFMSREKRDTQLLEAKNALSKGKKLSPEISAFFTKSGELNEAACKEAQKWDGFSILFSTKKLSSQEVVTAYYEKDIVEKAFQNMKSILGLRPLRHWLTQRVKAHIFICYLSYLLYSTLNWKLKNKKIKATALEALQELETMYKIYITDPRTKNTFEKTVTLTKKQEKILKAINKKLLTV